MYLIKYLAYFFNSFFNLYDPSYRIFPEKQDNNIESPVNATTHINKYYELTKNIRNYNILTTDEIDFIHTLSIKQLIEIIIIYDLHTQIIKHLILEDN